jgi:putative iron-only hydrogenase system regulator
MRSKSHIERKDLMESRIALVGIIVENKESTEKLNTILHEYSQYIIGRMGIPNAKQGVAVISIVMDAPNDVVSALSGKLGMLPQVSAKAIFSKLPAAQER